MTDIGQPASLFIAMPTSPDYYAILQVHPDAEREVIAAAYRKLAAKCHPDVNTSPDAENEMKQLNEAYEVLSDNDKRAAYDRSRDTVLARTSSGWNWRRAIVLIGVALVILTVARLRILGLLLIALAVGIWILWRR